MFEIHKGEHCPLPLLSWDGADGLGECADPQRGWHMPRAAGAACQQVIYPSHIEHQFCSFASTLFDAKHSERRSRWRQVRAHQSGKNTHCMLFKLIFEISAKTQKRVWWLKPTGNSMLQNDCADVALKAISSAI